MMNRKVLSKSAMASFLIPLFYSQFFIIWLFDGTGPGISLNSLIICVVSIAVGVNSIILGIKGLITIKKEPDKYIGRWAAIIGILFGIAYVNFLFLAYLLQKIFRF